MDEKGQLTAFLELLSGTSHSDTHHGATLEMYYAMAEQLPDGYFLTLGGAGEASGVFFGAEVNGGLVITKAGEVHSYLGGAALGGVSPIPLSGIFELGVVKGEPSDFKGVAIEFEASAVIGAGVTYPANEHSGEQLSSVASSLVNGEFSDAADFLLTSPPGTRMYYTLGPVDVGVNAEAGYTHVFQIGDEVSPPDPATKVGTLDEVLQLAKDRLNPFCFGANTAVEMADGSSKFIQDIEIGDEVLAFDPNDAKGQGTKVPRTVTQTHVTEDQRLIDFHGTLVTPGHSFLTGEGIFKPLMEILEGDGTVVMDDGQEVRARTGFPVGSKEDQVIPIGYPDSTGFSMTEMRAGTVYGVKDGLGYTIAGMMRDQGYHLRPDGHFVNGEGDVRTAFWEWGRPDAKLIAGQQASYADLLEVEGDGAASVQASTLGVPGATVTQPANRRQRRAESKRAAKAKRQKLH